jgi:UDP-N-acetylmuramoyl-L-alanyl-D-glutamate--2,6-diaminopimelate ligase
MKSLSDILYRSRIDKVLGSTTSEVVGLTADSRKVEKGFAFVAVAGTQTDGHAYIDQAIASGATAIVCEKEPNNIPGHVDCIVVKNSAEALGHMASNFYGNPSEQLKMVGITGTNGKTTTTTLLFNLFQKLGYNCGLISTVVNRINERSIHATHTTPDPVQLNALLREMVDEGCEYCFMEVSSHAIHQHRVAGIDYNIAVFTNISHDHLDYHGTFKEYIQAKKGLFDGLSSQAVALINKDDRNADVMVQNTSAKVRRFALHSMAEYKAKVLENHFSGLQLLIDNSEVYSKLIGGFNAYNLLAAYAVAMEFGLDKLEVLTQLSSLESVEGRFEYVKGDNEITAVVDYAHTPDALDNVLSTITDLRTGNEKVITIVGCGGDRDKEKRPLMAQIAVGLSDQVILTSDNPRTEDPNSIIEDMKAGLDPVGKRKTISLPDRKEAIKLGCTMASSGDIILIAGKGHENYQEIQGERFPFDDLEIVSEMLKSIKK